MFANDLQTYIYQVTQKTGKLWRQLHRTIEKTVSAGVRIGSSRNLVVTTAIFNIEIKILIIHNNSKW